MYDIGIIGGGTAGLTAAIYGQLRRGARHLPGYERWPNNQLGYGVLCVESSLPD